VRIEIVMIQTLHDSSRRRYITGCRSDAMGDVIEAIPTAGSVGSVLVSDKVQ